MELMFHTFPDKMPDVGARRWHERRSASVTAPPNVSFLWASLKQAVIFPAREA